MLGAITYAFTFVAILLVLILLASMLLGGKKKSRPRQNIRMPSRAKEAHSVEAIATAAEVAPLDSTAVKKPTKNSQPDDLKRIKGIGPTLENKLNSQGITQFAQIARWTAADRAKFSELLSFKGRIEREEWVKQAQALVNET